MTGDDFDYGDRKDDGQFENHPTIDEGEFEQSVRHTYRHTECGGTTSMKSGIAKSIARDPEYYTATFCTSCGDYYPTDEFEWLDGKPWVIDDGGDDE